MNKQLNDWVVGFSLRNKWKVAPLMDEHDLQQECFILYVKCADIAHEKEWDQKHLENYFKVACSRMLIDYASERTRKSAIPITDSVASVVAAPQQEISTSLEELKRGFQAFVYENTDPNRVSKHCAPHVSVAAVMNKLDGHKVPTAHLTGLIARIGKRRIVDFVNSY